MIYPLLVALPLLPVVAALVIGLWRPSGTGAARLAVASAGAAFAAAATLLVVVARSGEPVAAMITDGHGRVVTGLSVDEVGAVLAVLTTGVGLVVQSFAGRALAGDPRAPRFFACASLLTAATTAAATAATATSLAAAWVVAGLSLSALVGHRAGWPPSVRASRRVRRAFLIGDSALVAAVLLSVAVVGDIDLRAQSAAVEALSTAPLAAGGRVGALEVVTVLVVIAGVSRSALIPAHRWLPATLAAPTPVSALLHAGVVNGAGVLFVRLAPLFGASVAATHAAFTVGVVTTVVATGVMLVRTDVKGNLAWSTAGQMGFMVVQCAVGAFSAALLHIVGHGMYKAALFLGSGGAITAHRRHRHRPAPHTTVPPGVRAVVAATVPAAALAGAYLLFDPHLPPAGLVLVTVFAWATASRASTGWMRAAPFGPSVSAVVAGGASVVGILAYVGGLVAFEGLVDRALPAQVPAAVPTAVLVPVIGIVAVAAAALWFAPGRPGGRWRDRVYTGLLTTGIPLWREPPTAPVTRTVPLRRGPAAGSWPAQRQSQHPAVTPEGVNP